MSKIPVESKIPRRKSKLKDYQEYLIDSLRSRGEKSVFSDMMRQRDRVVSDTFVLPVRMQESSKTSAREVEIQTAVQTLKFHKAVEYVNVEAPLFKRPFTGDMEMMIADIDRVEITPASEFRGLKGLVALTMRRIVKQQMENLILSAIKGNSDARR